MLSLHAQKFEKSLRFFCILLLALFFAGCGTEESQNHSADTSTADTSTADTSTTDTSTADTSTDTSEPPAEWFTCSDAAECVIVSTGCCDYCAGGGLMSVNQTYAEVARDEYGPTGCELVDCDAVACAPLEATCDAGTCGYQEATACEALDEASCDANASCRPVMGAPRAEICVEDYDNWMSVFGGCMQAGLGCGDAETCATNPSTGEQLVFPDTCTPTGWTACDAPCPTVDPCEALDEASCEADTSCRPIMGASQAEVCAEDYSGWMSLFAGCMQADMGCGAAVTCAINPYSGERLSFPDTCTPTGWASCNGDPCAVDGVCVEGTSTAPARLCVRGETNSTEELLRGDAVRFQVTPEGCHSSSCTARYDVSCAIDATASPALTLNALFCLGATGDETCTADCSGGGFATCNAGTLADGEYTVTMGTESITFTVPSSLPHGGVCTGSAP